MSGVSHNEFSLYLLYMSSTYNTNAAEKLKYKFCNVPISFSLGLFIN